MLKIAFVSLSGGQGKTTCTFFMALLLAKAGYRVLAIDGNPQSDLTLYLDADPEPDEPTLLEVLNGSVKAKDAIFGTRYENLSTIASDGELFKIDPYLSATGNAAGVLDMKLEGISSQFDCAVLDAQPARSQICLTVVGAADLVVIPVEATTKGYNSALETLAFLDERVQFRGFRGRIAGIVPFRDKWTGWNRTIESRETIEGISRHLESRAALMERDPDDEERQAIQWQPRVRLFEDTVKESEQFKRALNKGVLLTQLLAEKEVERQKNEALERPLRQLMEAIVHD